MFGAQQNTSDRVPSKHISRQPSHTLDVTTQTIPLSVHCTNPRTVSPDGLYKAPVAETQPSNGTLPSLSDPRTLAIVVYISTFTTTTGCKHSTRLDHFKADTTVRSVEECRWQTVRFNEPNTRTVAGEESGLRQHHEDKPITEFGHHVVPN